MLLPCFISPIKQLITIAFYNIYQPLIRMYCAGINPGLLLYVPSLEYSTNARPIMGKKNILATEIAIANAIKQN